MKRLLLLWVIAAISVMPLWAEKISQSEALQLAQAFVGQQSMTTTTGKKQAKDLRLKWVEDAATSSALYIFNRGVNAGFVIVAADDRAESPIVGFADQGTFDPQQMPEAMKAWLQYYVREAQAADKAEETFPANSLRFKSSRRVTIADGEPSKVGPLLGEIEWNQSDPYNRLTPIINGINALTGCVATATAQIMYYHRWPEHGTGSLSYDDTEGSGQTLTADFYQHTYDWDAMSPQYNETSSRESGDAVALLMSDVGIALRMKYSLTFSGSFTEDVAPALREHFGYDPSATAVDRRNFSNSAWTKLIKRELDAGRPVVYSGVAPSSDGGHAFVCDGYTTNDFFHFNWGWSGRGNAWFKLNTMNPEGGEGFTEHQEMVCNIARPGEAGGPVETAFNWEYDETTATLICSGDGDMPLFGESPEDKPWYGYQQQVKHIVIGEGITSIAYAAFEGFCQLKTVSLPEGLEYIHSEAFAETSLSAVTFPRSLSVLDSEAFRDTRLTHVELGPNVEYATRAFVDIPTLKDFYVDPDNPYLASVDGALYDKGLTTLLFYPANVDHITLPSTVTTLSFSAFQGTQCEEIILPDHVTSIDNLTFSYSPALRKVTLPAKLTTLPFAAFYNCTGLEEVVVGSKLREIEGCVFFGCASLRSITFHRHLRSLDSYAFYDCHQLSEITCYAENAPDINSFSFASMPQAGTLTVPDGSDYSTWLDVLGPGWTIAYTAPEAREPNETWSDKVWAGYVNENTFWMENPLAPIYTYFYNQEFLTINNWGDRTVAEAAIRIDRDANPLASVLDVAQGKLYGLSVKGTGQHVQSSKVWVSTTLPATADDADIYVTEAGTDYPMSEWHDITFDTPVSLPDGPCYVGCSIVLQDDLTGYWPFMFQYLTHAEALPGDCFLRNSQDYEDWQNDINAFAIHHPVPAIRMNFDGNFMENDVALLSAIDVAVKPGQEGKTTLSLLHLGSNPAVNTIGIRFYDAKTKQWGDTQTIKVDRVIEAFSQRYYIEVPVAAKETGGCYMDSVAVVEINGYPCPHSTVSVPLTINVLNESLQHRSLVEVDVQTSNGLCTRADVGRRMLQQTMGNEIVTYAYHWDKMSGYRKYSPLDVPGIVLDGYYQQGIDPYYGAGSEGFGAADYIRKQEQTPPIAEISTTAVWRNNERTSLRFNSTIHSLVNLDQDRLSVWYVVVADGLHGTGNDFIQRNSLSGTTTDDINLQHLTLMPPLIEDYVYDAVGIFCPYFNINTMTGEKQRLNVPMMQAGSSVTLEHCVTASAINEGKILYSPDTYGLDYERMHVIAIIEDNLTHRVVNCVEVPLPSSPQLQADCVTTLKSTEGGCVQIGDQAGKTVSVKTRTGDHLTLTAIPDAGYCFSYWEYFDNSLYQISYDNPFDYIVNDNNLITAKFNPLLYRVDVAVSEGGIVTGSPDERLRYGDTITLTAIPDDTHTFQYWEIYGKTIHDNPLVYSVTDDVWIHAVFGEKTVGVPTLGINELTDKEVYNLQGTLVARPVKGLYIVDGRLTLIK